MADLSRLYELGDAETRDCLEAGLSERPEPGLLDAVYGRLDAAMDEGLAGRSRSAPPTLTAAVGSFWRTMGRGPTWALAGAVVGAACGSVLTFLALGGAETAVILGGERIVTVPAPAAAPVVFIASATGTPADASATPSSRPRPPRGALPPSRARSSASSVAAAQGDAPPAPLDDRHADPGSEEAEEARIRTLIENHRYAEAETGAISFLTRQPGSARSEAVRALLEQATEKRIQRNARDATHAPEPPSSAAAP